MDAVLGYHLNPMRCGVAKFNRLLAQRFGVPVVSVFAPEVPALRAPLLSIKLTEFTPADAARLAAWLERRPPDQRFHLFLHDFAGTPLEMRLVAEASTVYAGNTELAGRLRALRGDVIEAWAPGMIGDVERFEPVELSVFSFGMAHKVRSEKYRRLQQLLEDTGKSYSLYVSTALHENSTFDDEFDVAFQELQALFDGRAHFLGYLSDVAVYNRLLDVTFFAAFFDNGVRANNTSVNAALEAGCVVITNLDALSPSYLRHGENMIDIEQATRLPTEPAALAALRAAARATARRHCGWDGLARLLERTMREHAASEVLRHG